MAISGVTCICLYLFFLTVNAQERTKEAPLKVTSILTRPFLMLKNDSEGPLVGNDRYEGFIKDLTDAVARQVGFNYTLHLVKDGNYGSFHRGQWNGMIKELISREADIAAAPLTMTSMRLRVVDFSMPFMHYGTAMLMNKKDVLVRSESYTVHYLQPFSLTVWACVDISLIVVAILIYVIHRFDPYEKPALVRRGEVDPRELPENGVGILFCLWWIVGGSTLQGHPRRPSSVAGFFVIAAWWTFCIFLISFYIASLANLMSTDPSQPPELKLSIGSVADLVKQTEVKYGTLRFGATRAFFETSKVSLYESAWSTMTSNPDNFVDDFQEGLRKVKAGKYALLMDSTHVDYATNRDCELIKVGYLLDQKSYSFGLPLGSPVREAVSLAVLTLHESGFLWNLREKWWRDQSPCVGDGTTDGNKGAPPEPRFRPVTLSHIWSLYLFLAVGCIISVIAMAIEILHFKIKGKKSKRDDNGAEKPDDHALEVAK